MICILIIALFYLSGTLYAQPVKSKDARSLDCMSDMCDVKYTVYFGVILHFRHPRNVFNHESDISMHTPIYYLGSSKLDAWYNVNMQSYE